MSRPHSRLGIRALILTGLCAATLGLAACGDDEEATTPTTEAEATTSTTEEEATALESDDPEVLREQFNAALRETLTTTQGLTDSQADCAIAELEDTITDDVLQELSETARSAPRSRRPPSTPASPAGPSKSSDVVHPGPGLGGLAPGDVGDRGRAEDAA